VRRGSQLACASSSPFSSGTAGPCQRRHPSLERLRRCWTSSRRLHSAPTRRAAARVSHHRRHLARRVAAPSHGARATFPGAPCPLEHADQPCHPAARECVQRAPRSCAAGRLLYWTGPLGRGPADVSAGRVWQATTPRTVAPGQFQTSTVSRF
jgi:hypothetical protein